MQGSVLIVFAISLTGYLTPTLGNPPECPFPSNELIFFPVEGNCSQFWECFQGNRWLMTCPDGLYFNADYNICDYRGNVDCSRNNTTTQRPTTTPNPTTTTETTTDGSTPSWTPDPQCPYPTDEIVFFPHPTDCSKYLECYQGNKYLMSCPDGLYWNTNENACDYPENVDCDRNTTPERPTTAPNQTTTTDDPTPSWTPDPQCPYPSDEIIFFPHPTDCSKYLECYQGNKYLMSCPDGLYWNTAENACDYRENVNCDRS